MRRKIKCPCYERRYAGTITASPGLPRRLRLKPVAKQFLLAASLSLLVTGAMAQPRPSTVSMSCSQAAGLVASRGAIVLGTGVHTPEAYRSLSPKSRPATLFKATRHTAETIARYPRLK